LFLSHSTQCDFVLISENLLPLFICFIAFMSHRESR
jgi:hypothetical protein